jgi:hypothetical protein
VKIPRSAQKAIRDFVVVAAGTLLLALAERTADFGLPQEMIPVVSAVALLAYRMLRGMAGREPAA